MAVALEKLRSGSIWASREKIAELVSEGRSPMIFFSGIIAESHEASQEIENNQPQLLILGIEGKRSKKYTITPEEAKEIAEIQRELLRIQ